MTVMPSSVPESVAPPPADATSRQILRWAERLHHRPELNSAQCRQWIGAVAAVACRRFRERGDWDEAFRLLGSLEIGEDLLDDELAWVRAVWQLRESRRVARARRVLVGLLCGVLAYLFLVSPTVFVALENPIRGRQNMPVLDWSEGLYWSVITSTTVGYGDIVPQTPYARMFALFNALLGVLLMGVVAGLILSTLSPRRLP